MEALPFGLLACLHQLNYTNSKQPNIVQKVTQATVPPQSWFLHGATSFFLSTLPLAFCQLYIIGDDFFVLNHHQNMITYRNRVSGN